MRFQLNYLEQQPADTIDSGKLLSVAIGLPALQIAQQYMPQVKVLCYMIETYIHFIILTQYN